jgi:asparagine synthase (glutamine-hydrolysing)
VVALAARQGGPKLKTFSISFGQEYRNELPFSSLVAEHCGTEHRILELTPAGVLANLDETIARLIDPIGDPLTVPNAVLFQEAAASAGAVLNGEGGDPTFGGPKNQPMLLSELYDSGLESGGNAQLARERSYLRAHQKCYDDLPALLTAAVSGALEADALERELSPWFEDPRWPSFVNKLMALNLTYKGGHHILPKVDSLSRPYGVVPRSPLFDQDFVELAFRVPPQLKLRGNVEKYLLKRAVADLLPQSIVDRPKSGMLVPVEGWFQGPLLKEARARLLDGLAKYGVCERSFMERLLDGKVGVLKPRRGVKIWLLVTLESWLRRYGLEAL